MSSLREAATLALEALERGETKLRYAAIDTLKAALAEPQSTHSNECYRWHHECAVAEVNRLRAALAEPVQEPVAWKDKTYGNLHHQDFGNSIPLYTAPPQRPAEPVQETVMYQWEHRDGRASVVGPFWGPLYLSSPQRPAEPEEPVAYLWQHSETGRTRIVMPGEIITVDDSWSVVGPLYLLPQRPAPCAKHCEATAFEIEIRNLKARIAEGIEGPISRAVAAEREACIRIVEEYQIPVGNSPAGELACDWTYAALKEIREEIRARSKK